MLCSTPKQSVAQVSFDWQDQRVVCVLFDDLDYEVSEMSISLRGRQQNLLGKWTSDSTGHQFKPVVPFSQNEVYLLKVNGSELLDFEVRMPNSIPQTRISAIYPSADFVPENLLKIHIYFSGPMGEVYSENFITVISSNGDTLSNVFLPLQPELWNAQRDHLTLWLDPGRIKRGLGPNEDLGLPLAAGKSYKIHCSKDWKDHFGRALEAPYEKTIVALPADRVKLSADSFEVIKTPEAGSYSPLVIDLAEPVDFALALDCLVILKDGETIGGDISMDDFQNHWVFAPHQAWQQGSYQLQINSRLEDLAGNNLNHLFDQKIGALAPKNLWSYTLDFEVY